MDTLSICSLKNKVKISTLRMAFLAIITGGIYPLLWLYRNQSVIIDETKKQFSTDTLVIWLAICTGMVYSLKSLIHPTVNEYTYELGYSGTAMVASLFVIGFGLASCVLYVVWAFKAKEAIQQYALTQFRFDLKMNVFYTMIFNVYYINYCINDMPEALAKHQIIHQSLYPQSLHQEQSQDNK